MEGKINFGDQSVQAMDGTVRRIKLKANQSIRVVFTSEDVISRLRHYKKGAGYRRCLSYTGFCPACIAADQESGPLYSKDIKRAIEVFAANIFVYDTTPDCATLNSGIGSVHLFNFGADKFTQIRTIKTMYGSLIGLDLMITCTDEQFQKYSIQAYPPQMSFYQTMPEVKAFVDKAFKDQSYPLDKMAAKEVDAKQMVIDFGLNPMILETPEAKQFLNMAPEGQPATVQPVPNMAPQAPVAQAPVAQVPVAPSAQTAAPIPPQAQAAPQAPVAPQAPSAPDSQQAPSAPAPQAPAAQPAPAKTVDMSSLLDEL